MAVQKWPAACDALVHVQTELGRATPEPWASTGPILVGGCFVCFRGRPKPDRAGEPQDWLALKRAHQTSPRLQSQVRGAAASRSRVSGVRKTMIPSSSSAVRTRPDGEST